MPSWGVKPNYDPGMREDDRRPRGTRYGVILVDKHNRLWYSRERDADSNTLQRRPDQTKA